MLTWLAEMHKVAGQEVTMANVMMLAASLYKKLRSAPPDVRATVLAYVQDARNSGMIPLGVRPDHDRFDYVWLVFDETRLTLAERERYVRERTPPVVRGTVPRIVTIGL